MGRCWQGTVFRSTDGGATFTRIELPVGRAWITRVGFAPDYADSGEVFIGTSDGLFFSTDYLDNLFRLDSFPIKTVSAIVLSPNYRVDATLFATTAARGVYKSTDRGVSWTVHETGVKSVAQTSFHYNDLGISRNFANDGTVFLATFEGLFRSVDRGNSFQNFDLSFTRYEESHLQSVLYSGGWRRIVNNQASGTSFRVAADAGEEVSLAFTGTGIRWIGARASVLGKADVYLDEVLAATVDQYGAEVAIREVNYEIDNLPSMPHEPRIVVRGERNEASQANGIVVDAFDVIRCRG